MPYRAWDEYFVHQLPRTFDEVNDSEPSWSDRCYFNLHAPGRLDADRRSGYGNNPNKQRAHGYAKVALADGRHWDIDVYRQCSDDRGDLYAGPLRWTCVEPLQRWQLELGPNEAGIEWELHVPVARRCGSCYRSASASTAAPSPTCTHIKQPARYTGWVSDRRRAGSRSTASPAGATARSACARRKKWTSGSGSRPASTIARSRHGCSKSADGTVHYVDGGFTFEDGTISKRFVTFEHEVTFDGDRKRPLHADIVFTDEDGEALRGRGDLRTPRCQRVLRDGELETSAGRRLQLLHLEQHHRRRPPRDRGQHHLHGSVDALRHGRDDRPRHLRALGAGPRLPALSDLGASAAARMTLVSSARPRRRASSCRRTAGVGCTGAGSRSTPSRASSGSSRVPTTRHSSRPAKGRAASGARRGRRGSCRGARAHRIPYQGSTRRSPVVFDEPAETSQSGGTRRFLAPAHLTLGRIRKPRVVALSITRSLVRQEQATGPTDGIGRECPRGCTCVELRCCTAGYAPGSSAPLARRGHVTAPDLGGVRKHQRGSMNSPVLERSTDRGEFEDAATSAELFPPQPSLYRVLLTGIVALGPLVVAVLVIGSALGNPVPWFDIALMAIFLAVIGHGVTVGFHRLFTHRSFEALRPLKLTLAVLGSMAFQGSLIGWVADHRRHHRFVGPPRRPAFALLGRRRREARFARLLARAHRLDVPRETTPRAHYVSDLLADPDLVLIDRMFIPLCVATLALPAAIGFVVTGTLAGALSALLFAGIIRIGISHNVTWSINSVCHKFGKRSFDTRDASTNVAALSLFTMGESWHNNHHAFPRRRVMVSTAASSTPRPRSSAASRGWGGRPMSSGRRRCSWSSAACGFPRSGWPEVLDDCSRNPRR